MGRLGGRVDHQFEARTEITKDTIHCVVTSLDKELNRLGPIKPPEPVTRAVGMRVK